MEIKSKAIWLGRAAMGGLVSYAIPKMLVAAGMPIDRWATKAGEFAGVHFSPSFAMWLVTAIIFGGLLYLTRNWGVRHIHHGELSAEVKPTATLGIVATRQPAHDVSLTEAALFAVTGKWGLIGGKEHFSTNEERVTVGNQVADWLSDFEQKASDGSVRVWGRPQENQSGPIVEIDALHWRTHEAFPISVALGEPQSRQRLSMSKEGGFNELRVSKAEFERAWPHT